MDAQVTNMVKNYFRNNSTAKRGKAPLLSDVIGSILEQMPDTVRRTVKYHADGGNHVKAAFDLHISTPTFYRHLNKFYDILVNRIILMASKVLK